MQAQQPARYPLARLDPRLPGLTWPAVIGAGGLTIFVATLSGWGIVSSIGITAATCICLYLILNPDHENAFQLMVLTLPFLAAFVINIGGNLRVPYLFAILAILLGLHQRRLFLPGPSFALFLLFAFLCYALLSTGLGLRLDPPREVIASGFRTSGLRPIIQAGQLLLMVAFFYLTLNYISSGERLIKVARLIFWSLAIVALYGAYELSAVLFNFHFININTNPDFLENRFAGSQLSHVGSLLIPRPRSILPEPADLASYLLFSIPFAVALYSYKKDQTYRWVMLAVILLATLVFIMAWSRAGFISALLVLPLSILFVPSAKTRLKLILGGLMVYLVLGLVILPMLGAAPSVTAPSRIMYERISTVARYLPASLQGDPVALGQIGRTYSIPLEIFAAHPLTGVGLGNDQLYLANSLDQPLQVVTFGGLYPELIVQFGLIGTVLFLGFVATVLWQLKKAITAYKGHPLRPLSVASFVSIVGVMGIGTAVGGLTIFPHLWVSLAIGLAIIFLRRRCQTPQENRTNVPPGFMAEQAEDRA